MRIKSPSDEHIVNLKNYNYMNIQVVCNATLNFSKRWPSSMGVPMILLFRIKENICNNFNNILFIFKQLCKLVHCKRR